MPSTCSTEVLICKRKLEAAVKLQGAFHCWRKNNFCFSCAFQISHKRVSLVRPRAEPCQQRMLGIELPRLKVPGIQGEHKVAWLWVLNAKTKIKTRATTASGSPIKITVIITVSSLGRKVSCLQSSRKYSFKE